MSASVVVTASDGALQELAELVRDLDVSLAMRPLLGFATPDDWTALDAALAALERFPVLAVTSPRAARAFCARLAFLRARGAAAGHQHLQVWASGASTAAALRVLFGSVRLPEGWPEDGRDGAGARLAQALLRTGTRGPVLFPCGDQRREELPAALAGAGVPVAEVLCYRTVLLPPEAARDAAREADVVVVASPSVARLLAQSCPPAVRPPLVAIGPTTARAAHEAGWAPRLVAERPDAVAVADALRTLLTPH